MVKTRLELICALAIAPGDDPDAPVKFATGGFDKPLEVLSVYTDDNGTIWIDLGEEYDK